MVFNQNQLKFFEGNTGMQDEFSSIFEDERKECLVLKAVYDLSKPEQLIGVSEEQVSQHTQLPLSEVKTILKRLLCVDELIDHPTYNSGFVSTAATKQKLKDYAQTKMQVVERKMSSITQNFHGSVGAVQTGDRNVANVTQNNYSSQNLVDAAREIQQLLDQLAQTYPTNTQTEKMVVVTKAVEQIENNPSLKERTVSALKAAGVEGFKELIDNPLVNILIAAIEGWKECN